MPRGKITQFCGLDSESIGDANVDAQNALVHGHMDALTQRFRNQRVRYISLIEGNMSWVVSNQIGSIMAQYRPMYHGCKTNEKKIIGVNTTEEVKINMVNTARSMMQQRRIKIAKHVVCAGKRKGLEGLEKSASITTLFADQLKRLQQRTKVPRDIFGKTQSKITGKMGSHQDDLAIAGLLGIHWACAHHISKALPLMRS